MSLSIQFNGINLNRLPPALQEIYFEINNCCGQRWISDIVQYWSKQHLYMFYINDFQLLKIGRDMEKSMIRHADVPEKDRLIMRLFKWMGKNHIDIQASF